MSAPASYPRIPHLVGGRGSRDDGVLGTAEALEILSREAVVEEKLDGANVMLWSVDGRVECSLRSGPGGRDRAGQLGPLRAWIGERYVTLLDLLHPGRILYAEWLLIRHTIAYDALPSYLIGLDLSEHGSGFVDTDERDRLLDRAEIVGPPRLLRGIPESVSALEALMGRSAFGSEKMEGVVVRPLGGAVRVAKLLRPGFRPIPDQQWQGRRPRNLLAVKETSWR